MKKAASPIKNPAYDFRAAKRGAVLPNPGKTRITIYIDTDVLDAFRDAAERDGRGYQTAINAALRAAVIREAMPVEERLRAVVREELAKAKVS
jgi:uncharacterized protein (DUF4415 family)